MISSARVRLATIFILGVLAGCGGTRSAAPSPATKPALSPEEYARACAHDPRSPLRLYGCYDGRFGGPLLIVDGLPVRVDTSALGRAFRDSVLATIRGRVIDSVQFLQPDSAQRVLGSAARDGALLIWTRRP